MSETTSTGEDRRLFVGPSPHLRDRDSIPSVMRWVVLALLPAVAVSLWFFGLEAARVHVIAVAGCLAVEWACLRWLRTPGSIRDGSALVTGLLLAMNLPPTTPWWMILVGSVVAIFLAKHVFGGLGSNLFNPALTARVFLLVAWPAQMTTWLRPGVRGLVDAATLDTMTGATPLGLLKEGRLSEIAASSMDLFVGQVGGSLGEVSAAALLLGGLVLLARRVITWEIPATFLGTVVAVTGAVWVFGGPQHGTPWFHLVSGGLMLGAFFMATDMVTSPMTFRGRLIFGVGCGLLTAVIRLWGGYPEGVSFAILLMNAVTPLIDRMVPTPFGRGVPKAKEAA
ncbi:MAG TPA: RnfABCDGE type electron transport complex subunit D [Myxococcota bacterium]|nr:RnfABCDGE type electron transport complex subunit D [Myxococcota bacterium]HQK51877.1 RnfABCDGE type electron transport complex subunit D [Myxococcota bacterium]